MRASANVEADSKILDMNRIIITVCGKSYKFLRS